MPVITGAYLKKIREERHIPLEQVASATRIRLPILQDLEVDDYSELSSTAQAKGFLRIYAAYLGVSEETTSGHEPEVTASDASRPESDKISPFSGQGSAASEEPPQPLKAEKRSSSSIPSVSVGPSQTANPALSPAIEPGSEPVPTASQLILQALGRELVARRHYLNLSIDEAAEHTHIPKNHIAALEKGDLSYFSNTMQARGMLLGYGRFLNLDTGNLLSRFADALQEARLKPARKRRIRSDKQVQTQSSFFLALRRFFTLDLFFGTLLVLGILFFLIWGIARMTQATSQGGTQATIPAVMDVLMNTPSQNANGLLLEPTSTEAAPEMVFPTPTPFYTPQFTDAALEVIVLARQNCWLRVSVDGEQQFQGRLEAGNVMSFVGEEAIGLETGNLAGLNIIFNQEEVNTNTQSFGVSAWITFNPSGVNIEKSYGAGPQPAGTTPTTTPRPTATNN